MKTNGNDKALESYKIFPIFAWILVVGFALFVYTIAMDLMDTAERLGAQADWLEENAKTPVKDIVDFDRQATSS
jgi:hypothetical protein